MNTHNTQSPTKISFTLGGAPSVTVIVRGNGICDPSLKSWTKLFAFQFPLMPFGKTSIIFSIHNYE